jgi:hypothetical protein
MVLREKARVAVVHPNEIAESHLRDVSVILVDLRLDYWPERDEAKSIAMQPKDGLAVSRVLRSFAANASLNAPKAYAILSANLDDLPAGSPVRGREHIIARSIDLDWVFSKAGPKGSDGLLNQVTILAEAVSSFPMEWPESVDASAALILELLGLKRMPPWHHRALEDLEACRPPLHDWANATNGMSVMRWLLHRVLPYPTMLLDSTYLAARLRVTPRSLRDALNDDAVAKVLGRVEYKGILRNFDGARWWRAGIESLLWKWTAGNPFEPTKLADALRENLPAELSHVEFQPVVILDDSFRPMDGLRSIEDAVEIQPDDWPAFADPAWIAREDAQSNPELVPFVLAKDRDSLKIDT